uniref:Uncharacterized protein LOC100185213 n=1 Tax=Phallusia mammillata TaxID=59560 RepID=A0A6F9DIR7_9ASCI|nr:uncharacterized protein LOC100185213 [Phallusia mammillata]
MSRQCCIKSCPSMGPVPMLITMYPFPKSAELGDKWMEFIATVGIRGKSRKPGSLVVCSKHFEPSCFENLTMFQMGFATKLFLKSGAIPSIIHNAKEPKDWKPAVTRSAAAKKEVDKNTGEERLLKRTVGIQTNVKLTEFGQTFSPETSDFTQNFDQFSKTPIENLNVVRNVSRSNATLISNNNTAMYTVDDVLRYYTRLQLPGPKAFDNKYHGLFKNYKKAFTYTGNGDLYHKSAAYECGYSQKFVVHQKHRKELILSHFHVLQKDWSIKNLCKVLSPYFYWPNLIEDYKEWKKDQKPEKESAIVMEPAKSTKDTERETSPSLSAKFLGNFNLALKNTEKSRFNIHTDHDYIADKLTVKRMLCPSDPFEGPPAKIKRTASLPTENIPTNVQNKPMLKTQQLRKTLIGKPQPVSTSLIPVTPKQIPLTTVAVPASLPTVKWQVTPSKFSLIPDSECPYFQFVLGVEEAVHRLNGEVRLQKVEPNQCAKCKTDYTPMWHYHLRKIICEKCWKKMSVVKTKIPVSCTTANKLPQQMTTKPNPTITMHQVGNKKKNQIHLKVLGARKQMKIVVKKAPPNLDGSGSSNKMSLMEAANKIRDHINSRLVMLKKIKPGPEKKIHTVARITTNSARPANVIMQRRKPPSSEELIRCMQQTQKTNKKT